MVKNWADHCSSDEEDVDVADEPTPVVDPEVLKKEIDAENRAFAEGHEDEDDEAHAAAPAPKKTYEYPTEPPFTAYVGNLSYTIMDPQELADKLTDVVQDALGIPFKITDSRIIMDRRNQSPKPRHRGFAYVQVETLDMLKALMQLNDNQQAVLDGRTLVLDTSITNNNSSNSRRRSDNLPDGSRFRGGRFQNKQRQQPQGDQQGPPLHRQSLKLAPRSKPVEGSASQSSSSNIFGGGKARDEQTWRERRQSEKSSAPGRGGGGRGRGRGSNKKERKAAPPSAAAKPKESSVPAAKPVEKATEKKVTNKFAALDFSDDSD